MSSMITQSGPNAYANVDGSRAALDASARKRADRLARATAGQMEAALALLSVLDPEAFEIAFTAIPIASDETTTSPSRCAANAAAWSASSPTMACAGSTSAAMAPPPVSSRSTSLATTRR